MHATNEVPQSADNRIRSDADLGLNAGRRLRTVLTVASRDPANSYRRLNSSTENLFLDKPGPRGV